MKNLVRIMVASLTVLLSFMSCDRQEEEIDVLESVSLDRKELTLKVGEKAALTFSTSPAEVEYVSVEWSSENKEIASVDGNGIVEALAEGETRIVLNVDGKTDRCLVKITDDAGEVDPPVDPQVEEVRIVPNNVKIHVGEKAELKAEILPEGAVAASLEWSSLDEGIAVVSDKGVVEAKGIGETSVKVVADGKTGWCSVVVAEVPVESVKISEEKIDLEIGKTFELSAEILPANATSQNVTWSSENSEIATVSESGMVEAVALGSVKIFASAGGVTSFCVVNVIETPVESIVLNYTDVEVEMYKDLQLEATITPEGAVQRPVTWTSSDEYNARVDENGLVKTYGIAEVDITATCGGKSAVCHVRITRVIATRMTISHTEISLAPEGNFQLSASAYAEGWIQDAVIAWSSDNESVATVTEDGLVTAVAVGTANITASCDGVSVSCTVTVKEDAMKKDWKKYDVFDVEGYGRGIVVAVAKDKSYIKIMSFETSNEQWAVDGAVEVGYSSDYNDMDGRTGSDVLAEKEKEYPGNFPAYEWCVSLGEGWYMPSAGEADAILDYNVRKQINQVRSDADYMKLADNATFWTNGESARDKKRASFYNCEYGYIGDNMKTGTRSVFALKRIELD